MGRTILLIDDDTMARRTLAGLLNRMGYRVYEAEDGTEGLSSAQSLRPDIIVSDYKMPGMTGGELLQEVRALPDLEKTPFIMISGYIDHMPDPEAAQPDVLLTKPVTFERLAPAIYSALSRR